MYVLFLFYNQNHAKYYHLRSHYPTTQIFHFVYFVFIVIPTLLKEGGLFLVPILSLGNSSEIHYSGENKLSKYAKICIVIVSSVYGIESQVEIH